MKNYLIALMILASIAGCKKRTHYQVNRARAIDSVQSYLNKTLDDPGSYQAITFGKLQKESDLKIDTILLKGDGFYIEHSYRAKNSYGALVKFDQKFIMNPDLSVNEVRDAEDN